MKLIYVLSVISMSLCLCGYSFPKHINHRDTETQRTRSELKWEECLKQSPQWYGTGEAIRIADNVLFYQRANGGWPKNIDMAKVLSESGKRALERQKQLTDTTIDNGATFTQLVFLARVITARNNKTYETAFINGLNYLLAAQYENGGFPQYYPLREGYYSHITYNDGAMIGVLKLLRDVAQKKPDYVFVSDEQRKRAAVAVGKGIDCILDTQVVVAGTRTVWAAQHDARTLGPAPARAFEPVALSGGESVEVTRFLMSINEPKPEVIAAIEAAVAWFKKTRISGFKWTELPGGSDHVLVKDETAGSLWARFYELGTNRPIFAGRDGIVKYNVAEIEAERRNGYQWYVNSAERLLSTDYPKWREKRFSKR